MRRSGELAPLRRRPGPHARVDDDSCQCLERWLQEQPDLTLAELAARLQADGRPAGEHAHRVPGAAAPGPAPKKKTVHATERDTAQVRQARRQYWQDIARHAPTRLKFVDESGVNIAMTRRYGRARRGQRVHDAAPKTWGRNVTVLGSLSCQGL